MVLVAPACPTHAEVGIEFVLRFPLLFWSAAAAAAAAVEDGNDDGGSGGIIKLVRRPQSLPPPLPLWPI